jgi:AmmeMemoRadiSam system protein B
LTGRQRSSILEEGWDEKMKWGELVMIRRAAFAGDWYPGDPSRLRADLASYVEGSVIGVVAPHAGYMYSGHVAGAVYSQVRIPNTVVVLCVNHRGAGSRAAIMSSGSWETPLGPVSIREDLAEDLKKKVDLLEEDGAAHAREHSLEMQVPFLQYRNQGVHLVPICLQRLDYAECAALGEGLARAVQDFTEPVLLVASTDMTHFESQEDAKRRDMLAIDRVLEIDPRGLYETVTGHRISMCGFIPTTSVLCACKSLGVTKGTLVRYATSGDISGEYSSVVGYAGIYLR